jgi:hypothetical protein
MKGRSVDRGSCAILLAYSCIVRIYTGRSILAGKPDMISHLYRFRPIERLLRENELQNQEVFFAKPENLIDPMEGFRDVFWKGDEIVWRNLLRLYLLCVERAFTLLVVCHEDRPFGWDEILVVNRGDTSVSPQHRARQEEIIKAYFSEDGVKSLIPALAARLLPIRRNELAAHLRGLHLFALSVIRHCYEKENPEQHERLDPAVFIKLKDQLPLITKSVKALAQMEKDQPINEFQIDAFYASHQQRVDLINLYNEALDPRMSNRNFVFLTFCGEYVRRLEALVYPNWYAACFMRECRDSSVWGTYGRNHTAVCLKFKVTDTSGKPSIRLKRQYGFAGDKILQGFMEHTFQEIVYESNHLPVDFFRSLGRLPIPILRQYWYTDCDGNRSPCGDDIFKAEQAWRDRYWAAFDHGITRKLKDWSKEQEYRLILRDEVLDYSPDEARKTTYDFNDLEAIIFGIRTELKDKLAICKIVEQKCRESGRPDFKFYQAFYSPSKGEIDHAEIPYLKFA